MGSGILFLVRSTRTYSSFSSVRYLTGK